ncbi:MAG TPA: MBL fold metallo-hydrolase [Vicinamibacterales bacterium]|jgi:glyoxylase-like metal-dependent hydrolase (beta-lactamase superfamily II)
MKTLTSGIAYTDLHFQDVEHIIATAVLHGADGIALIDPGPSSALPHLKAALAEAGVSVRDIRALLLTHIHLDHAGASGSLVAENPAIRVYVHERGAPHMANPERLVASATQLWGDEMDQLWGEVRPVRQDALVPLSGGEQLEAGSRRMEVLYTPGHASHHVSYFNADAGIAFVGDTAGMRLEPAGPVVPPTPPPDIDLEAWRRSLQLIADWEPDTLFLTHFGPHAPVAAHLGEMTDHLEMVASLARQSLSIEGGDEDRERWFSNELRALLRRKLPERSAASYEVAGRFDLSWRGLARYWRKRA